ncbi:MAG: transglutaminase domain-containing protein [Desulfobacterales bacterium]|nr:transglutaminase domain-containing protein [Desulfobacterales bacterium]
MTFPKNTIRIAFIIIWVILFGALLKRDYFIKSIDVREDQTIKRGKEESFAGIYFQRERIGFVKNRLTESGTDEYILYQDAFLYLNILNESHPVDMRVKATLTRDMLLKDFIFHFTSPFYKMNAEGYVEGQVVNFTLTTGKETISDTIRLKKQPFLSTNRRSYLLKQGLQPGDKLKVPYFDPISLSGKDTVMEYKGQEKILLNKRVYNLHHFVETFSGIKINSWLDDEGKVVKEESPAGFVFIAEPEFKAKDLKVMGKEILSSVSIPLTGGSMDLTGRTSIRYKLTLPEGADFDLDKDRQSLEGDILTLQQRYPPETNAAACNGFPDELASTPYIQTKNQRITDLAQAEAGEETNDLNRIKVLAEWVFENLEKRPVLGIPDALTTLSTRMGDCNEHAALFAALARNAGIPTRIASGVTFFEGAFYYHAWNEVCLDDSWYSVDTTKNQFPADLSHIKFVEGETDKQVKIAALLGKLKIEIINDN